MRWKTTLSLFMLVLVFGVSGFLVLKKQSLFSSPPKPSFDSSIKVLTYGSFVSDFGPGPRLKSLYEEQRGVQVNFLRGGDSNFILERMRSGIDSDIDIVVGLDQLILKEASRSVGWRKIAVDRAEFADQVKGRGEPYFVPFDWAPMTFIYRRGEISPPTSFDELTEDRFKGKISLQDPRTSTPGLQFLWWIFRIKGEEKLSAFFKSLKPSIHSISPSWSASYGLFQREQTKMTFSYVTSVVYHWKEQGRVEYQPVRFDSGHPVQVEFAGVPDSCQNCDDAADFARFLTGTEAQKILMERNFMFPVRTDVKRGTIFEKVPELPHLRDKDSTEFTSQKEKFLDLWLNSLQ